MMQFKLNWKPDRPDFRDYQYESHPEMKLLSETIPQEVDLRPQQSPVVNQYAIGSCTGNAIAGHEEFLQLMELKQNIHGPETFGAKFEPVSRLFIYANERIMEGTPLYQDSGAAIRDGIMSLRSYGICRESVWAYNEHNAFIKPSDSCYAEAINHKSYYGYRINNYTQGALQMKQCLAHGYPFVFGISVYSSFVTRQVAKTGMVPMPSIHESILGGHALLCVGYSDANQWFIVKNSWGNWGDKGYCYIPYSYLANANLCSDIWTMRRVASGI